jgi:uncharacterized protein
MIVVSDTSPLTNLAAIGQLGLLRTLFDEVHVPEGVWAELTAPSSDWPGRDHVASAAWIQRHAIHDLALVAALRDDLDRGEAEAIALALSLHSDLVLLDEKEGRRVAQRLGLRVVGVVGLLIEAKERGLLPAIRPHLRALRQTAGFYVSEALYRYALELVGERP